MAARRSDIASQRITDTLAQARVELPEPVGAVWIAWSAQGLVTLRWDEQGPLEGVKKARPPGEWTQALRAYARGKGVDPAKEIPVELRGTAFQKAAWLALRAVPRGRVRTYAGIASDLGKPRAMRAVGAANGANPIPIVVPCHRIVGAGLTLGGYSGGLDRKRGLLQLEGVKLDKDHLLPGQLALF
ncbi:MAG: methylated-DNA--[protein]-cysteine S-methyltransferase [Sandaracinus sp.]|nr:methylated-DNA--[protein]-cysteine S-methyltransferase [Sandaracinus sp.]